MYIYINIKNLNQYAYSKPTLLQKTSDTGSYKKKFSMFFFKCKIQVRGNTYTGIFKYVTRTLKKQEVQ